MPKYKVGLIGYGYWGPNLARVISSLSAFELVAIADKEAQRLQLAADKHSINTYDNAERLISEKEIDIVVISTPLSTHFEFVKQSLKAGKHVFCEKPLAFSSKEVKELGELAADKKLLLMVGQVFEFNSIVQHIGHAIQKKQIGELLYLSFTRTGLGPVRKDSNVVYDLASHDISILLYWLQAMPVSVSCIGNCILQKDREDVAFINLTFPNNVIATIAVSWVDPMKQRKIKVVGSKQMMVFDDVSVSEKLKIIQTGIGYQDLNGDFGSFQLSLKDGDIIIPNIAYPEPLKKEWEHFAACLEQDKSPQTDAVNALRVAKVLEAVQQSLKSGGQKVSL